MDPKNMSYVYVFLFYTKQVRKVFFWHWWTRKFKSIWNIPQCLHHFNVNHIHGMTPTHNQNPFIQRFIFTRNFLGTKIVQVLMKALASFSCEDVIKCRANERHRQSISWKSSLLSMQTHYQLIPVQWPCRTLGDHGQLQASASFHLNIRTQTVGFKGAMVIYRLAHLNTLTSLASHRAN